jgi:hypothetical protein
MKKHDLVKTKSGHVFLITEVNQDSNYGVKGQLVVKMWGNGKLVYDIENDESKKPQSRGTSGYLTDWGFDEEVPKQHSITGASWTQEGKYSYDTDPLDIEAIGNPKQYDTIKLDSVFESEKKTLVYLDYDSEFKGWFKEENYTPTDVRGFEDDRWNKVLNKKVYTDSY